MRPDDIRGRHIHFMGVGGIGMSALAVLAQARGAEISGCDREASANTERLARLGITVGIGHDPAHATTADLLVHTSAVPEAHPERRAAAERQVRRGTFLAALMRGQQAVGICGTHGKTTTSWLTAHILIQAGFDPTVVLGGVTAALQGNVRVGQGPLFVAELDESDASFLEPELAAAVITNIESEHLGHYGTVARMEQAFADFAAGVARAGLLVSGIDCPQAARLHAGHAGRKISCGLAASADLCARPAGECGPGQRFTLLQGGRDLGPFSLSLPGLHNLKNALAATAVAMDLGVPLPTIRGALADVPPLERRLQLVETVAGVPLFSDYAHHPTEIRCTIQAARALRPGRLLVAFQPHLYSRTRDYADAFGEALATADEVIMTDIYPAREDPIPGVTAELIVRAVRQTAVPVHGPIPLHALAGEIRARLQDFGIVILMGAGSIDGVRLAADAG